MNWQSHARQGFGEVLENALVIIQYSSKSYLIIDGLRDPSALQRVWSHPLNGIVRWLNRF